MAPPSASVYSTRIECLLLNEPLQLCVSLSYAFSPQATHMTSQSSMQISEQVWQVEEGEMNPTSSWCRSPSLTEIGSWNQMSWGFPFAFPYRASCMLLNSSPRLCLTFSRKSFWTKTGFPKISSMFVSPSSCKMSRALPRNVLSDCCSELVLSFFQVPSEDKGPEQILPLAPDGVGKPQLELVDLVPGTPQNKGNPEDTYTNTHTVRSTDWLHLMKLNLFFMFFRRDNHL